MFKYIQPILTFLSIILFYFILEEFSELYVYVHTVHPYGAYGFITISAILLFYFVIPPVYPIIEIAGAPAQLKDEETIDTELEKRFQLVQKNKYVQSVDFILATLPRTKEGYEQVMKVLRDQPARLRNQYAQQIILPTVQRYRTTDTSMRC